MLAVILAMAWWKFWIIFALIWICILVMASN